MEYTPVFLIYLNRSGSTFLAKNLDQFTDIEVTPEGHLKDNIYKSGYNVRNRKMLEKYLNYFYKYDKNNSWKIQKKTLINYIEKEYSYPLTFNHFLESLFKLYFSPLPPILIYKSPYIFFVNRIKKLFPDAKFILIIRDIRGIYNSQKKTSETIRHIPMAETPIETAYKFNKAVKIIKKYEEKHWFYWLKYEDFIKNTEDEIKKILSFLNIPNSEILPQKNYAEKLADSQKQIHPNLNKKPIKNRIDAWKKELSPAELFFIYKIAGQSMKKLSYNLEKQQLNIKDWMQIIKIGIKYLFSPHGKIDIIRILLRGDV